MICMIMTDNDGMIEAHHVESHATQHTVILGGGVRVPLEEVLKVSAAGFNVANSRNKIGNPAPMGFLLWFLGCFTSGFFLLKVQGIEILDAIAAFAIVAIGTGCFIVGNLEVLCDNAFGSAAMTIFAMFWFSWGSMYVESFGIADAYAEAPSQLADAKGFFFMAWFVVFVFVTQATIRSTVMFFAMFFTFTVGLLMLTLQSFLQSEGCEKAAGVLFVISGILAFAQAYGGLATPETAYVFGKTIRMPGALRKGDV